MKTGIPRDKMLHLIVGAMMGTFLIPDTSFSFGWSGLGWVIIFILGSLKELIYDGLLGFGNNEGLDILWTMIIPTLILIIDLLVKH